MHCLCESLTQKPDWNKTFKLKWIWSLSLSQKQAGCHWKSSYPTTKRKEKKSYFEMKKIAKKQTVDGSAADRMVNGTKATKEQEVTWVTWKDACSKRGEITSFFILLLQICCSLIAVEFQKESIKVKRMWNLETKDWFCCGWG